MSKRCVLLLRARRLVFRLLNCNHGLHLFVSTSCKGRRALHVVGKVACAQPWVWLERTITNPKEASVQGTCQYDTVRLVKARCCPVNTHHCRSKQHGAKPRPGQPVFCKSCYQSSYKRALGLPVRKRDAKMSGPSEPDQKEHACEFTTFPLQSEACVLVTSNFESFHDSSALMQFSTK